MAAKKIPKEEIDRVKFMENIRNQINLMSKATQDLEKQIRTFQDLYLRVVNDEIDYNLKYYVEGTGLTYERLSRKKIGF